MPKTYRIYGLVDPRDSKIFYVGKTTKKPYIRLKEHIKDNIGMVPRQERIREIQNSTTDEIQLVILQDDIPTNKMAFTREVFWIEMLSMVSAKLTNASIDFDGVYFLSDHYLSTLPDGAPSTIKEAETPIAEVPYKSASEHWHIDIELASQPIENVSSDSFPTDFFRIEDYETFNPINKNNIEKSMIDFHQKRIENQEADRLLNHGFPITKEEVREVLIRRNQGENLLQLEQFFQRSRASISYMLDTNLIGK